MQSYWTILHVNNNSFTGPLIIGTFEKRAPGLKFSTETHATRIILTFPGTELPQAKGPFIRPFNEELNKITNIVTFNKELIFLTLICLCNRKNWRLCYWNLVEILWTYSFIFIFFNVFLFIYMYFLLMTLMWLLWKAINSPKEDPPKDV